MVPLPLHICLSVLVACVCNVSHFVSRRFPCIDSGSISLQMLANSVITKMCHDQGNLNSVRELLVAYIAVRLNHSLERVQSCFRMSLSMAVCLPRVLGAFSPTSCSQAASAWFCQLFFGKQINISVKLERNVTKPPATISFAGKRPSRHGSSHPNVNWRGALINHWKIQSACGARLWSSTFFEKHVARHSPICCHR